jgi:hypothetical protein
MRMLALLLFASCATGGMGETLQLSSTCPHACVPGQPEENPDGCCYDVDGYGWSGCAWNGCGIDEACRKKYTAWTPSDPVHAPCGSMGIDATHMVATPCVHPDGRVLVPLRKL